MSQNVTLPAEISPAQSLAVAALANGSTITEAAERAGVARETVSRWANDDPDFIAELQNTRAEMAAQLRWRARDARQTVHRGVTRRGSELVYSGDETQGGLCRAQVAGR